MNTSFLDTGDLCDGEIFLRLERAVDADPARGFVPAYYFEICLQGSRKKVGHCNLRLGHNEKLYYGGNIGYGVDKAYRGRHYAEKACRLLFRQAQKHGMKYLYITCNPDNSPSKKTCEHLCENGSGELKGIVDVPPDNDMFQRGEKQKCVFYFKL